MQYLPGQLAQLEVDDEANRRRQAQAQALQQAGFNPVQGGNSLLSLLTSVMSTVRGGQMMNESDAKASEILAKRFEIENQAAAEKAAAENARRLEDRQWAREDTEFGAQTTAKYREAKNIDPLSAEGMAATLGLEKAKRAGQPGPGPSEMDRKIAQLRQLGASDDQIRGMLLGNQGGSNAPSGYRPRADGGLEPIPGGPADPAAQAGKPRQLPPEMAGKIALAEDYLASAPSINSVVKSGALTGLIDGPAAKSGYGKPGEIVRKIQSGRDALQRTLTGAGMPASEADEYADRYLPTIGDTAETLGSKQRQLQSELGRFVQEVRGGQGGPTAPAQQSQGGPPMPKTDAEFAALPSGTKYVDPDDGKTYRKP